MQIIEQIVHINLLVNQSVSNIVLENCEITDPKSIADAFNHFTKIGINLQALFSLLQKLPVSLCHFLFVIVCFCPQLLQMESN